MIHTALDEQTSLAYNQIQTVKLALRITPGASKRVLRLAFDKLVERHDSLRLRYVQSNGDWKAEILPKHPTGLLLDDLSDLSEDAQTERIFAQANQPMTALSDPLFEMHLIKCGRFGDVVLTRAHHSIIDGYGLTLLIEDLLKFVLNLPITSKALSHEEFVTLQQKEIKENRAETEAFWYDYLIPPPEELNIGLAAKGLPVSTARNGNLTHTTGELFDAAQSKRLDVIVKQTGISAFSYIHAAFSETLCDLADQDEVLINSILGRRDVRLANFVGAEIQEVLLRFTRRPVDIHESARQVQQDISETARHIPTDLLYALDGRIAKEVKKTQTHNLRFFVHVLLPTGKLDASPFRKLFSQAMGSKISIGFVTLERIDLYSPRTFNELFLAVSKTADGPNAALTGSHEAFSQEEVDDIAARMVAKLGLAPPG